MALNMQEVNVKIDVETNKSRKNVQQLNQDISKLSRETGISEKSLQRMANELNQIEKINSQVSKSTQNYDKSLQGLNKTIGQVEKVIDTTADSFTVLTGAITIVITAFKAMKAALKFLTDGEAVARITNLLEVLKKLAYVKGFDKLSIAIETVSKSIEFLHTRVLQVTLAFEKFTTSGDDLLNIAYDIKKGFSSVGNAAMSLSKVALASFLSYKTGLLGLMKESKIFQKISKEAFQPEVIVTFQRALLNFQRGNYVKTVQSLGKGFLRASKNLTIFSNGMLQGSEKLFGLAAGFGSLGVALSNSENGLVSFIGKTATLAAVITGGLSTVILALTSAVGVLAFKLGESLGNAMDKFTEKSQKASESARKFSLVVGNVLAEQAVKSGDLALVGLNESLIAYQKTIEDSAQQTIFSGSAIRDSLKLIIAETRMFGFTAEENINLFNRATEIAAGTGRDLQDVTLKMIQGLAGSSQGLLALGINLKDSHVEMKNLDEMMGQSLNTFDDMQKAQFRMNDLLGQSSIFLGANASAMDTFTGAAIRSEKALDRMQQKIGSQARLMLTLENVYADFLEKIADMPEFLFDIVGVVGDVGSVFLKVSGTILKYIAIVLTLIVTYKTLQFLIVSVTGVQLLLNKAFTFAAAKVGVTTVAVTSLNAVLLNLSVILKAVIIRDLKMLTAWLAATSKKLVAFGAALLALPITWVVLGIAALVKGFIDLQSKLNIVTEFFEIFTGKAERTNEVVEKQKNTIGLLAKTWNFFKNTFMLVGALITQILTVITYGFANLASTIPFLSDSVKKGLDGIIQRSRNLAEKLQNFRELTNKDLFGTAAYAAEQTAKKQKKLQQEFRKSLLTVQQLTDKIKDFRDQTIEVNKAIDGLNITSGFANNELGQLEAAIALKERELQIEKEKIQLSGIPALSPTLDPAKVTEGLQELEKLKTALAEMNRLQKIQVIDSNINKNMQTVQRIADEQQRSLNIANETGQIQDNLKIAQMGTFDAIRAQFATEKMIQAEKVLQFDAETKIIQANRDKLIALGAEQSKIQEINDLLAARSGTREEMVNRVNVVDEQETAAIESAGVSMATGFVSAAQGGADALLGNIIDTVGAAFGPVGQMVAGIVNMLRQGFDFMKTLGKDLLLMIVELPKMVAEGLKGLLTGIIEAIMELFSDPDMMVDMLVSGLTVGLELMTIVFKALPKLIKKIFSLKFWMEVLEGIWIALRDAFVQAWDAFWAMFTGEGLADTVGSALIEGIEMATDTLGGFGQKLFSVVGDAVGLSADDEGSGVGGKADDKSKTSNFLQGFIDVWRDIYDFFEGLLVGENSIWAMVYRGVAWFGEGIWDGLKDMLSKIPEFLMNGIQGISKFVISLFTELPAKLVEGVKNIASGLWNAVKYFFEPFFDLVMAPFTAIGKFLTSLKDKFLGLFKFPSSQGTVEKWMKVDIPFLKFAEGGKVPNPSGAPMSRGNNFRNDVVPAMLSPDEFVLPRSITQDSKKMTLIQKVIKGEESYFGWGSNFIAGVKKVASGKASVGDVIKEGSDLVKDVSDKTGVSKVLESAESLFNKLSSTLRTVYNWVKKNIGGIDLKAFIANPVKEALRAIKQGITAFIKPLTGGIFENMFGQQFGGTSGQTKDMSATSSKMSVTSSAIKTLNKAMRSFKFPSFSFHTGGMVGNDGMANLLGGEFVINRRAVNNIGAANLGNLNLTGGQGAMGNSLTMGDVNVTIVQADSQQLDGREMAEQFMEELKNRSLRGDFVISQRGIR